MKKNKNVFIFLLNILVIGLGGFIIYHKIMKDNDIINHKIRKR